MGKRDGAEGGEPMLFTSPQQSPGAPIALPAGFRLTGNFSGAAQEVSGAEQRGLVPDSTS